MYFIWARTLLAKTVINNKVLCANTTYKRLHTSSSNHMYFILIEFVYISAGVVTMASSLTIVSLLIVAVMAGALMST
jgi:hypothetical protein